MRLLTLAVLVAAPLAAAQTFQPSGIDLTAGGTFDPQIACTAVTSNVDGPVLLWFDAGTESVFLADRQRNDGQPIELLTASDLDAGTGVDVDDCTAGVFDDDTGTLVLALSAASAGFVTAITFDDVTGAPTFERLAPDGQGGLFRPTGLAVAEGRLYAAVQSDFSIVALELSGPDQTPTPLATEFGAEFFDLTATSTEFAPSPSQFALFTLSTEGASPSFRNTLLAVRTPTTTPSLEVVAEPYEGPLTPPPSPSFGRLISVVAATADDDGSSGPTSSTEAVFVLSVSAAGPEIARYGPDGTGVRSATEDSILDDIGRPGGIFSPIPNGALLFSNNVDDSLDALLLLGGSEGGGRDEVLIATGAFTTPTAQPSAAPQAVAVSPNPFSGRASVEVDGGAGVRIDLVDVLGRTVATVWDGPLAPGRQRLPVDGAVLQSGTYVVRVESAAGVRTQTVTVVR